jgi:hypothetical protein
MLSTNLNSQDYVPVVGYAENSDPNIFATPRPNNSEFESNSYLFFAASAFAIPTDSKMATPVMRADVGSSNLA